MANGVTENIKKMKIVTYQTGVDVLGFPLYVEHKIIEVIQKQTSSQFHKNKKLKADIYTIVTERKFKQH